MPAIKPHVLILEDDPEMQDLIAETLEGGGFRTTVFADQGQGQYFLTQDCPDALILDLRLAPGSGLEVLRLLRSHDEELPVLIVSGMTDKETRLRGFDLGCDDFIEKPFDTDELLARVRRFFRPGPRAPRGEMPGGEPEKDRASRLLLRPPFLFDAGEQSVLKDGVPVAMRRKLFLIFHYLALHEGSVVDRDDLLQLFWGRADEYTANSLHVHLRQLRRIIQDGEGGRTYIRTIRNRGLLFESRGAPPPPGGAPDREGEVTPP